MTDGLESDGIETSEASATERTVRQVETWHRYQILFESSFDLDSVSIIFWQYLRPPLAGLYRSFTSLKVLIGIETDDGRRIVQSWRSISATFRFSDAFEALQHNIGKWLERADYDVVLGVEADLRAPTKREKTDVKAKTKRRRKK